MGGEPPGHQVLHHQPKVVAVRPDQRGPPDELVRPSFVEPGPETLRQPAPVHGRLVPDRHRVAGQGSELLPRRRPERVDGAVPEEGQLAPLTNQLLVPCALSIFAAFSPRPAYPTASPARNKRDGDKSQHP